jgi:hypothetical protein
MTAGLFVWEETKMSEVEELREQIEALQQQFANYVEAQSATGDIESILTQGADEATAGVLGAYNRATLGGLLSP